MQKQGWDVGICHQPVKWVGGMPPLLSPALSSLSPARLRDVTTLGLQLCLCPSLPLLSLPPTLTDTTALGLQLGLDQLVLPVQLNSSSQPLVDSGLPRRASGRRGCAQT